MDPILAADLRDLLERESARLDQHASEIVAARSALLGTLSRVEALAGHAQSRSPLPPGPPRTSATGLVDLVRSLDIALAGPLRLSITRFPPDPQLRLQLSSLVSDVPGTKRALLPVDLLHQVGARQWLAARSLAGEQQRFTHDITGQYLVISDTAVLASTVWGDPDSGFTVLTEPMVVQAFTALFEASWAHGVSQGTEQAGRRTGHDVELLRLMSEGLKDEAIARYLGISLRTVRRRVAEAMDASGVRTRFQLGLAAAPALEQPRGSPSVRRAR